MPELSPPVTRTIDGNLITFSKPNAYARARLRAQAKDWVRSLYASRLREAGTPAPEILSLLKEFDNAPLWPPLLGTFLVNTDAGQIAAMEESLAAYGPQVPELVNAIDDWERQTIVAEIWRITLHTVADPDKPEGEGALKETDPTSPPTPALATAEADTIEVPDMRTFGK